MKKFNYLLSLGMLAALFFTVGCGDDGGDEPDLTIEEQQIMKLTRTWSIKADGDVTLDGDDAPGDWTGATVTFNSDKTMSVSVPSGVDVEVFATSGTFSTIGTNVSNFTISYNSDTDQGTVAVTDTTLKLSFTLGDQGKFGARQASVEGAWVFNFAK